MEDDQIVEDVQNTMVFFQGLIKLTPRIRDVLYRGAFLLPATEAQRPTEPSPERKWFLLENPLAPDVRASQTSWRS